ncbi:MAG: acyltransferase [Verrucomicrobia bacterium]|nr:acyltransferase [Verrucomicrobiota bacterium]
MASATSIKNKNADGLRGIACLAVALNHFVGAFFPTLLYRVYPDSFLKAAHPSFFETVFSLPAMTLFYNGSFPVMIFFVLSGYVLAAPYYHPNHDTTRLHRRLWGRYLRLNIPIATSILISFFVYQCHGYFNTSAAMEISPSQPWLRTFFQPGVSQMTALQDMIWQSLALGEATFNPVYWSLKAEFIGSIYLLIFYIITPKRWQFLFLLLLMWLIYFFDRTTSTPVFIYAILLGSLLNLIRVPKNFYLLFVIIGIFFGALQEASPFYHIFPPVLKWYRPYFYNAIGALFITGPIVQGFGTKFFQSRAMQFLGTISFPLYLLHFIVLCSFSCWLYLILPQQPIMLALNFALYLLVAISLSLLFEKYVDQPAIKLAHHFTSFLFKK